MEKKWSQTSTFCAPRRGIEKFNIHRLGFYNCLPTNLQRFTESLGWKDSGPRIRSYSKLGSDPSLMNEVLVRRGWGVETHTVKLSKFLEARKKIWQKKQLLCLWNWLFFFVLAAISRIQWGKKMWKDAKGFQTKTLVVVDGKYIWICCKACIAESPQLNWIEWPPMGKSGHPLLQLPGLTLWTQNGCLPNSITLLVVWCPQNGENGSQFNGPPIDKP